jgi:hypothetical protein
MDVVVVEVMLADAPDDHHCTRNDGGSVTAAGRRRPADAHGDRRPHPRPEAELMEVVGHREVVGLARLHQAPEDDHRFTVHDGGVPPSRRRQAPGAGHPMDDSGVADGRQRGVSSGFTFHAPIPNMKWPAFFYTMLNYPFKKNA